MIPTLNEQAGVAAAVRSANAEGEVIVVDGGGLAFPAVRAFTCPRRGEKRSILGAMLRNWRVFRMYSAGANPSPGEGISGPGRTG